MKFKDFNLYLFLGLFGLYFNEIIILNEKFLLLGIFIGFIYFVKNSMSDSIESFFLSLKKDLVNEIFLFEYSIDTKYSFIYYNLNVDLLRKRLFHKIYNTYLKGLNFLMIFYYNYSFKKDNSSLISTFEGLVNDVYYFIMKKHLFIKLNFLYRSYYYIFYKFSTI